MEKGNIENENSEKENIEKLKEKFGKYYYLIEKSYKATRIDEFGIEKENPFGNFWYQDVVKTKNLDLLKFFINRNFSSDILFECLYYSNDKDIIEYLITEIKNNFYDKTLLLIAVKNCLIFAKDEKLIKYLENLDL